MRRTSEALSSGASLEILAVNAVEKYLVYKRRNEESSIIVALNFSGEEKHFVIDNMHKEMMEVFTKEKVHFSNQEHFVFLPWAFSIWINQPANFTN